MFTQSQKIGLLGLSLCMILGMLGIYLKKEWGNHKEASAIHLSLPEIKSDSSLVANSPAFSSSDFQLDINQADSAEWVRLRGIGPVLSQRIIKYRTAIGGFDAIDDIGKVYGIKKEVMESIRPFLILDPATIPRKRKSAYVSQPKSNIREVSPIEINSASQADFEQFSGIGPVLGQRIIRYRNSIGGFQTVNQIKKVYGLPAEVFERIEPYLFIQKDTSHSVSDPIAEGNNAHRRIQRPSDSALLPSTKPSLKEEIPILDLNEADSAQLVRLPGIGAWTAQQILNYRKRIGFFISVDQLQDINRLTDNNFQKMSPYLTVGEIDTYEKKDLNRAGLWDLTAHRKITTEQAEQILNARKQLGRFSSWREVSRVSSLDKSLLIYLRNYFFL